MPTHVSNGELWLALPALPEPLRTPSFVLEPLAEAHAALDYAALMSCRARLRRELAWAAWPPVGFTLEDNRIDLRQHYAEFVNHEAFAYTVLAPDRRRCLGCVYLEPCAEADGGQLSYWLVDEALGMESTFLEAVLSWVHGHFGLRRVVVPLRADNPRAIGVAAALGLVPWLAQEDEALRGHECFMSTAPRE